jgi:hypothetical protein
MKKVFLVFILWFLSLTNNISLIEARDYRSSDDDVAVDEDGDWIIDHYRSHPDWITSNNYECVDSGKNCSYTDLAPAPSYVVPINFEYKPSDLCSILYPWTYTRLTDNKCLCPLVILAILLGIIKLGLVEVI